MERVWKPTTLPTTLIAWGAVPLVLAAPALDAREASAEPVIRIPSPGSFISFGPRYGRYPGRTARDLGFNRGGQCPSP